VRSGSHCPLFPGHYLLAPKNYMHIIQSSSTRSRIQRLS
jgi:hypothetical protein